jgi:saccharopine dehydrogenase-like NADP-dependent oxidoreductase
MSHVVVLGAGGAQAAACIRYLLAVEDCRLTLADRNEDALVDVVAELDPQHERTRIVTMDMADASSLAEAVDGCDVIANFVGPFHRWGEIAARAAVSAGAHYVDVCDDDKATKRMLVMSGEAADAGVTLLTGLGSGPGVTNILAGVCASALDEIQAVEFGWFASGDPRSAGPAAFEHLLWGFCTSFTALVDDREVDIDPFDVSLSRIAEFGADFDVMRLWAFPHPEAVTFRHFVPGLHTSINRGTAYPVEVMDVLRAWHTLGYADASAQQVPGLTVSASEFAVGHFLTHGVDRGLVPAGHPSDASGMEIRVRGTTSDGSTEFVIRAASQRTMASETGVPAAVGVAMLLAGEVEPVGTIAPECLDPHAFFARFARRPRVAGESGGGLRIERCAQDRRPVRLGELLATYQPVVKL